MRILITNDDGINAPGLKVLEDIAAEVAGPGGEVWVVAPAFEKSGVAHCINYAHPTMIVQMDERRFAAEGAPADCVLAGVHEVMGLARPDLILSGVNKGNNSAENTVYSGTIGAAMEGALQGVKSIALSQFYGPANLSLDNPFEAAAQHGAALIQKLLDHGSWGGETYQTFYNINFPPVAGADVKGHRVVAQGLRPSGGFGVESHLPPNGRKYLWIKGNPQNVDSGENTDATVNLEGWISVTPMRCDLTAHDLLAELEASLG
ncbi:5'-nucleotidase /3'-nucleotidase /exopolyphosphatase [Litoreibacter ponti]|uniref:5'-nucleotidase SurE n=1 Tax=Litoreibacter ponti TaxID=1510457 RepID=A0A2T6BK95_9RHOB|nr:5'/3'-nucleotidase SurE [Litoreibacter ponti]PTX56490.1 5'-nucleotidase /3'-nucleotidase /exopolyphosphatase [Litoreibacter ponti]